MSRTDGASLSHFLRALLPSHPFWQKGLGWPCPVRSALKRKPMQDFNYFSIMFYYNISTTYQKIGDLFCLVHIYGLSHSVTWPFFCHSLLNISLSMSIVHSGYISLENKRINILQYGVRICKHPCQSRSLSSEAIDYWFDVILEKNVWLFLRSLSSAAQKVWI